MMYNARSAGLALIGAAIIGLSACGGEKQAAAPESAPQAVAPAQEEVATMARVEGEVFYRERIMLPPGVEVEVQLEDISRADAMATVMSSVTLTPEGGPPFAFSLEYNPADIDERMTYALRARITAPDGSLLFTNTEHIDPFSGNPVKVMVHGIAGAGSRPAPEENAGDSVAVWILETLGGEDAPLGAGGHPVDLQMNSADNSAAGFSGCNRYTGGIESEGSSMHGTPLKFGNLAATRRACMDGGELELKYLATLALVDAYRMEGDKLALLAGGQVVATFTAK